MSDQNSEECIRLQDIRGRFQSDNPPVLYQDCKFLLCEIDRLKAELARVRATAVTPDQFEAIRDTVKDVVDRGVQAMHVRMSKLEAVEKAVRAFLNVPLRPAECYEAERAIQDALADLDALQPGP